jgi:hypothetical protein
MQTSRETPSAQRGSVVENGLRHVEGSNQIFECSCPQTFLTYRKSISPLRVSAGRVPQRPSRRSEGPHASP